MMCIICNSVMNFFFSKQFQTFNLNNVEYWKCNNCGFTISKTHAEMTSKAWERLNLDYHSSYHCTEFNQDDPRWIERLGN